MDVQLFAKTYLLGNEDAKAFPDAGLYQLARSRGYTQGTDEFNWHVSGGAAYRFNGHTFATASGDVTVD